MKTLHITTVHPRKDTRIYYRECLTLKNAGYDVILMVADGLGDTMEDGFQVIDIGKYSSRFKNFIRGSVRAVKITQQIDPDLVHFHDPELIFAALRLHILGYPIVFDIHENISVQILDKSYIPKSIRGIVSRIYSWLEKAIIKRFHLVIAENSYAQVYRNKGRTLTTVLNLPEVDHFKPFIRKQRQGYELFYIGGVSNDRGLETTLKALRILNERNIDFLMHFVGKKIDDPPPELLEGIQEKVLFYGRLDPNEGFAISTRCIAGLAVLKPIKNYIGSYPTKIFEYMAIGLCVITSDFPLYREVVEKHDTGICLNPEDSEALANAIQELIENPQVAEQKAINGLQLVTKDYNWTNEGAKLISLYESVGSRN